MKIRVSELCVPPRLPDPSFSGVLIWRSWAWCMNTVPSGMRWETTARADTVPLRFFASIHSLSRTPIFSASAGLIHTVWPPRPSVSMYGLS